MRMNYIIGVCAVAFHLDLQKRYGIYQLFFFHKGTWKFVANAKLIISKYIAWRFSVCPCNGFPFRIEQPSIAITLISTLWWRHQMETFSALLALCVGNSSVTDEFPFLWYPPELTVSIKIETLLCPLWRDCNIMYHQHCMKMSAVDTICGVFENVNA